MSQEILKLSQAKINALSDEKLSGYKDYLKQMGVPDFEIGMIERTPAKQASAAASKGEKVNPTLAKLLGNGLTKTSVRESLAKYTARVVVIDNETGNEVLSRDLVCQDSSSGNVMLFAGGQATLPGYKGSLQLSCSLTASKSGELPE